MSKYGNIFLNKVHSFFSAIFCIVSLFLMFLDKMLECPVCKKEQLSVKKLHKHLSSTHMLSGHYPAPYLCGQERCSKTFCSFRTLCKHLRSIHGGLEEDEQDKPHSNKSSSMILSSNDDSATATAQTTEEPVDDGQWDSGSDLDEQEFRMSLEAEAVNFVGQMRANSSVTTSTTLLAVEACNSMVEAVVDHLQDITLKFVKKIDPNADTTELLEECQRVSRPLDFLRSDYLQMKYFREHLSLIEPDEMRLEYTNETFVYRHKELLDYHPLDAYSTGFGSNIVVVLRSHVF